MAKASIIITRCVPRGWKMSQRKAIVIGVGYRTVESNGIVKVAGLNFYKRKKRKPVYLR